MIKLLKNDLYKEKSRIKEDKNIKINNKELIVLKEKLIKAKAKYEIYLNFRNYLYSIKDSNYYNLQIISLLKKNYQVSFDTLNILIELTWYFNFFLIYFGCYF